MRWWCGVWGERGARSEEEEASLIIKGGEGGLAGWRRLRDGRPGSPHYGRCLFLEEKEGGDWRRALFRAFLEKGLITAGPAMDFALILTLSVPK